MGNKMRWDNPRGLKSEPNLNAQPYTKAQKKADRKWIRKQKRKQQKLDDVKSGIFPPKRRSGAQHRKLKRRRLDREQIEKTTGLSTEEAANRWE